MRLSKLEGEKARLRYRRQRREDQKSAVKVKRRAGEQVMKPVDLAAD